MSAQILQVTEEMKVAQSSSYFRQKHLIFGFLHGFIFEKCNLKQVAHIITTATENIWHLYFLNDLND